MASEIIVTCTPKQRRKHKRKLKRYGLRHTGENTFIGTVPRRKYAKFCEYCRRYRIRYRINNSFGVRNAGYRTIYFQNHKPFFGSLYFCVYCGRLVPKKKVSVDHLYPVDRVSKDARLQKRLKRHSMSSVNDKRNLVASCRRCNLRKGTKTGFWIIRGKIGKSNVLWLMRHAVRIAVFVYAAKRICESGLINSLLQM